ncbi:MAG TPA: ectonucleotide pyrophosphatase/phosphodiesterase [Pyrinomonadaceae bacterium]|nr:ectonucleotide pyrophosphatase/phosphodiesterase [Pyrinomonadaceae bacterium]
MKKLLCVLVLLTFAQQWPSIAHAQKKIVDLRPTVILISLDGFRYDYVDKYKPATIGRLARQGVRAKWMIPSFPTKTFPNHYTIVTGLYPAHHGIVENNVYDFGEIFKMDDRKQVEDSRWWGGEPIWATAQKQGQIAGTYFFVGSEAKIADEYPAFWRTYNGDVPQEMRIDKALGWLDLPAAKRPTLIAMYFSDTDDVGHEFGPDAEETGYAVQNADRYIKRLTDGLARRGIADRVNIIIVSDHGMAARDQRNAVVMDEYFDTTDKTVADPILTTGEIWQIFPKPGKEDFIMDRLKPIKNATCWRKADIPARFHYNGPRVAPIICTSNEGWSMTSRKRFEDTKKSADFRQTRGSHGYDNRYQSMQATFIAHGPAFKSGYLAEPFENVHLYELMCKILGLKPAKNSGNLEVVRGMLR